MKPSRKWLRIGIFLFTHLFHIGTCDNAVDKDLTLTYSQKQALDQFRIRVVNGVPHEYMKQDVYLIRWLRAKNFNINQAEEMLIENLKWRKNNKIDSILKEDWSAFKEKYVYTIETYSKDGKPIVAGNFGDWDLREAAFAGRMPKLIRYCAMIQEEAVSKILSLQVQGKNVTQYEFLVNMDNYNIPQHGCVQCLPFYFGLVSIYENYYPLYADHIVLFNTPPVFQVVLQAIRPIMSPVSKKALKVYGQNKIEWSRILLEIADKEQLAPEYGGMYHRKTQRP